MNIQQKPRNDDFLDQKNIECNSLISNFFKDNYDLIFFNIIGDGNCFFRALSLFLIGTQEIHEVFRNKIRTLNDSTTAHLMQSFDYPKKEINLNMKRKWASDIDINAACLLLE